MKRESERNRRNKSLFFVSIYDKNKQVNTKYFKYGFGGDSEQQT